MHLGIHLPKQLLSSDNSYSYFVVVQYQGCTLTHNLYRSKRIIVRNFFRNNEKQELALNSKIPPVAGPFCGGCFAIFKGFSLFSPPKNTPTALIIYQKLRLIDISTVKKTVCRYLIQFLRNRKNSVKKSTFLTSKTAV